MDGEITPLALEKILYIESVDGKCFVYTQEKIYGSAYKLYELEERLEEYMFVRVSKY
ncbi:MAG: LytTR family transcriptional regulator DNA-binding domain-containing protein [Lachnospiraceae bacterium]|nr:LytTR family transcriptional regulator DNA-binding domain-containing protein [Lachnospiraceae bacterium]